MTNDHAQKFIRRVQHWQQAMSHRQLFGDADPRVSVEKGICVRHFPKRGCQPIFSAKFFHHRRSTAQLEISHFFIFILTSVQPHQTAGRRYLVRKNTSCTLVSLDCLSQLRNVAEQPPALPRLHYNLNLLSRDRPLVCLLDALQLEG